MSAEYSIIVDEAKCVQCHACEVACKTWNNIESDISFRKIKTIWIGKYPDIRSCYVSIGCMHCAEPACVEACPVSAVTKRESDGIVVVNAEICTGCQACFDACPFDVPQYGSDGKMRKCDLCLNKIDHAAQTPVCVTTCPTQAIKLVSITGKDKLTAEQTLAAVIGN
ncbi:MAG: 4Fe-4S dicluster domain-containing protein [Spirochaetes bacterium]|nr:4Fe-4S dicluster domain-containing protein [Spirochaetota bacterium]